MDFYYDCSLCGMTKNTDRCCSLKKGLQVISCLSCYRKFYCRRCERSIVDSHDGSEEEYCESCDKKHGYECRLNDVWTRAVSLAGESPVKMGVEIEYTGNQIMCSKKQLDNIVALANKDYPNLNNNGFITAKKDGSVRVEFNTDAISFDEWVKQYDRVAAFMAAIKSHKFAATKSAGIHIHVSRCGFISRLAQENFVLFINRCFPFWIQLSKRNSDRWAKYLPRLRRYDALDIRHKYVAVNTGHTSTLEIRTFKTTLNPDTFFKYLAITNALVKFCHVFSRSEFDLMSSEDLMGAFSGYCLSESINVMPYINAVMKKAA